METEAVMADSTGRICRRAVLKGSALLVAMSAACGFSPLLIAQEALGNRGASDKQRDSVVARAARAAVEIESGRIEGYIREGIFTFKGVPYGDSTGGANRFSPPRKPTPWAGVRSARQYGCVAPQEVRTGVPNDEEAFIFQWNDGVPGEDCLRVNVWTPGINDNKKRPVMVWLHGGGFSSGSSQELLAYDGENLARRGDVVVVSLNHRLNLLGFMDLSQYGDRYAQSGNVGMLDIVAGLQWVRGNVGVFGGDPQRVLIFGQSGGGAKVDTLMAMPAAKGLFHRAIVESGSFPLSKTQDNSQKLTALMLSKLGLAASRVEQLHTLPYATLRRASAEVLRDANAPMSPLMDIRRAAKNLDFTPVIDGRVLPALPFGSSAPEISADVPMIIGSTLNELGTAMNHPEFEFMTEADLLAAAEEMFPKHAQEVVAAFRHRTPQAKRLDLRSRIVSAPIRQAAIRQAAAKAALNRAPAFLYWFTWQTPIFDGRPGAFHCSELPFVFSNTDRCDTWTGGGADARALSARMADAWIQFAHTGNPNRAGTPEWPAFSPRTIPTMVFDNDTRVLPDPDQVEQASIANV